jgi:hypothetical protein
VTLSNQQLGEYEGPNDFDSTPFKVSLVHIEGLRRYQLGLDFEKARRPVDSDLSAEPITTQGWWAVMWQIKPRAEGDQGVNMIVREAGKR